MSGVEAQKADTLGSHAIQIRSAEMRTVTAEIAKTEIVANHHDDVWWASAGVRRRGIRLLRCGKSNRRRCETGCNALHKCTAIEIRHDATSFALQRLEPISGATEAQEKSGMWQLASCRRLRYDK